MSSKLFWAPPNFEWHTLLSTYLSNQLFWALFLAFYSFEQFFEPSFERWNSFEHFFEHSQECTYSQEHFFEWIYSHECSFGHFLKGSWSTRTLMHSVYKGDWIGAGSLTEMEKGYGQSLCQVQESCQGGVGEKAPWRGRDWGRDCDRLNNAVSLEWSNLNKHHLLGHQHIPTDKHFATCWEYICW